MSKKKMLIVEDEPDIAAMQRDFFEMHEFKVDVVTNGYEAVQICHDETYDFILSDIKMPKADGFYFLDRFKRKNFGEAKPKFFFVTGVMDLDQESARALGADAVFLKPINFGRLLRAIVNC
jgi:DNA-binding response OmpR family regulator